MLLSKILEFDSNMEFCTRLSSYINGYKTYTLAFGGHRDRIPMARGRGSERPRGGATAVRGRGAGRGGRGRGRGGAPAEDKSVEDLDADLESYHAEAMQTN